MIEYHNQARRFELNHQWAEAAEIWDKCSRYNDRDICRYIADCIARGDAFRKKVSETLGPEPDISDTFAYMKWHKELQNIKP